MGSLWATATQIRPNREKRKHQNRGEKVLLGVESEWPKSQEI